MQSSSPVYTRTFIMTKLLLNILCLIQSKCCAWRRRGKKGEGKKKKTWYKSKARTKRLIIFQQKRVRMVGLRLYTLPFVRAHSYCPSINGDIKKALANSTGKLSLGVGPAQTGRAGLGFPARGLECLHWVYVADVGFALSLRLAWIRLLKVEKQCTVHLSYGIQVWQWLRQRNFRKEAKLRVSTLATSSCWGST